MLEKIKHEGTLYALIFSTRHNSFPVGLNFLTNNDANLQVATIRHSDSKIIPAHIHPLIERTVYGTPEVLYIIKGRLHADFYTENKQYFHSTILNAGDLLILQRGGHGFEVLEEVEMIEVKQGPYVFELDKEVFKS